MPSAHLRSKKEEGRQREAAAGERRRPQSGGMLHMAARGGPTRRAHLLMGEITLTAGEGTRSGSSSTAAPAVEGSAAARTPAAWLRRVCWRLVVRWAKAGARADRATSDMVLAKRGAHRAGCELRAVFSRQLRVHQREPSISQSAPWACCLLSRASPPKPCRTGALRALMSPAPPAFAAPTPLIACRRTRPRYGEEGRAACPSQERARAGRSPKGAQRTWAAPVCRAAQRSMSLQRSQTSAAAAAARRQPLPSTIARRRPRAS